MCLRSQVSTANWLADWHSWNSANSQGLDSIDSTRSELLVVFFFLFSFFRNGEFTRGMRLYSMASHVLRRKTFEAGNVEGVGEGV